MANGRVLPLFRVALTTRGLRLVGVLKDATQVLRVAS